MDVIYRTSAEEATGGIKDSYAVAKLRMHIVIGKATSPPSQKAKNIAKMHLEN